MGHGDNFDYDHYDPDPLFEDDQDMLDEEFLEDEHQLKKDIAKLKRQIGKLEVSHKRDLRKAEKELKALTELYEEELKRQQALETLHLDYQSKDYEEIISSLRGQIRELLEKNLELKETSNLFLKGLEHLKRDEIMITETKRWERKGVHGTLEESIARLALAGRIIISICPMKVTHQGETIEALIVYKYSKSIKST